MGKQSETKTVTKPELDKNLKTAIKRFLNAHPEVEGMTIKEVEFSRDQLGVKAKKEKDPNAPKPPLSAYINFCNAKRSSSKTSLTAAALGEMWKDEKNAKEKQTFIDAYAKAKSEYDAKIGKTSTKSKKEEVEEDDDEEEEATESGDEVDEEEEEEEEDDDEVDDDEEESEEEKPSKPAPKGKGKVETKPAPKGKTETKPAPKGKTEIKPASKPAAKPAKRAGK